MLYSACPCEEQPRPLIVTRATVAARPGWSDIVAVKSGEVVPVNDSIASEWGPRIVLFLKAVASAVKTLEGHAR